MLQHGRIPIDKGPPPADIELKPRISPACLDHLLAPAPRIANLQVDIRRGSVRSAITR
jgi:hypothetical protein